MKLARLGLTPHDRLHAAITILLAHIVLICITAIAKAQTIDIDRVASELEPEIQRTMKEGKIPSATVALVAGDRVIWTGAYGYSNVWARTPATLDTVYLIGSTF